MSWQKPAIRIRKTDKTDVMLLKGIISKSTDVTSCEKHNIETSSKKLIYRYFSEVSLCYAFQENIKIPFVLHTYIHIYYIYTHIYIYTQGVSGGTVNILEGCSMDYSQ